MSVQPLRQFDYLDALEQELLARIPVCALHGVMLDKKRRCCVCTAKRLERVERQSL